MASNEHVHRQPSCISAVPVKPWIKTNMDFVPLVLPSSVALVEIVGLIWSRMWFWNNPVIQRTKYIKYSVPKLSKGTSKFPQPRLNLHLPSYGLDTPLSSPADILLSSGVYRISAGTSSFHGVHALKSFRSRFVDLQGHQSRPRSHPSRVKYRHPYVRCSF